MAKWGEKLKGAVSGAREKISDHRSSSRLRNADLCLYNDAWKIVYPEFEKAIGRVDWHKPAPGASESDFQQEVSLYLQRIWPEDYEPEELEGSVAAIFNFTIIYLVCILNLECSKEKFKKTLDYAIRQSSLEDLWAYFVVAPFVDTPHEENLKVFLPKYLKSNFPDLSPDTFLNTIEKRLGQLQKLQDSDVPLLFHSKGIRNSTVEAGSGPQGSLLRYIEMYTPEFLGKRYISPLFNLHPSLKPNTNQQYVHWLFCEDGALLVPASNNRKSPIWIPGKGFEQLLFGIAYDALTENGVAKYENYKLFMYSQVRGRESSILYQYLGSNREKAFIALQEFQNDSFPLLADYFPVDWTEEVIDQSSHYTRTTTTYWTWG